MAPSDRDDERGALLPRVSLNRPVTVFVLACAIVMIGAVSLIRLPIQLMPSGFDPAFMMVRVPYPGANPTEIEKSIVLPLEDAFYTVGGLRELSCRANTDSAFCWAEFHNSVDMEETYNEVADRVERLRATDWPDDIDRVYIRRFNPDSRPVMHVSVGLPGDLEDPHWIARHRIAAPLERVEGVAQVDLEGLQEKQIFIEPDRDAMESHNLNLRTLVSSLRRANFALSSGDVRDGGRKLLVRSVARFESLDQIRNLPIRADGLELAQVATVRFDHPPKDRVSRLDGQPAVIFEIFKESEANTVGVTEAVQRKLEGLFAEERSLQGAHYNLLFNQGEVILDSMRQLRDSGLLGALFAVGVLYFFLRRLRVTLLITLAIPASLLGCLVILYFSGATINVITMLGMLICTGMLVDNAVVVVENIDRYRREGLPVRRAALRGSSEIALALTMATTTTIAVFLPIVLLSEQGMMRFFLTKLSMPVVFALLTSLLVALFFVPVAAAWLLRSDADAERRRFRPVARMTGFVYRKVLEPLHGLYRVILRWALVNRAVALVIVLATLAGTYYPFTQVETSMQGRHQRGGRTAGFWFNLPNSYSIEQADKWFQRVEQAFDAKRAEVGIRHLQTRFWNNRGMVRAILKDADETDVGLDEAIEALKKAAPEAPGVQMYVNWQRGSSGDASLNVSLYGEDTGTLAELAEEAERRLRALPDLISVEPDLEAAQEEVRIRVDRDRALRYGVSMQAISGTVSAALRGQRLPRFRSGEREIEIRVQFPEEDRQGVGKLAALPIPSESGKRIPLEALAEVNVTRGYGDIHRENRRTSLSIKLNTTRDNLRELRGQVRQVMNGMNLPQGYRWDYGGSFRWESENNRNMLWGLLLSVIFIYLIMGFLFESYLLPLSVMPSIFLSWIGVFWLLWLTDTKLDMMGGIGLILLAGVVVNNGIVLVDLINRLRSTGLSRLDATLRAGDRRFRPILMTAVTTIMGMLPLAFSKATFVGMPYESLGKTFVGGLFTSTTLTLVVVPLFYTLLDDAQGLLGRLIKGVEPAPALPARSVGAAARADEHRGAESP
jgi:HAE1 family hydrophobic/amphiphilic exporter-1